MPQEHHVLRCFSCETFQVHIVKKVKKWECKICGAKQSVKRNFGRGSGKDCRNQVMKLNELRLANSLNLSEPDGDFEDGCSQQFTDLLHKQHLKNDSEQEKPLTSKWEDYLEEPIEDNQNETQESTLDFFMEENEKKIMKKRVKKMSDCHNPNKKFCKEFDVRESSPVYEEANNFVSLRNLDNFENNKTKEKAMRGSCLIQLKNEPKFSKYTKFLDKKEENGNNDTKINTYSNIFDSDPTDLESILSFE